MMNKRLGYPAIFIAIAVTAVVSIASKSDRRDSDVPSTIIWAWDRPENLRFLPAHTGVAFLVDAVTVRRGKVTDRMRVYPVQVRQDTYRIAVLRLDTDGTQIPNSATSQIVHSVLRAAALEHVDGVQIDFDTRRSEREWYRNFLRQVRNKLAPDKRLSITALASWCEGDDWLSDLPIDEAVPMIFRLGPERNTFRRMIATGEPFREALCNESLGLSTDELVSPSGARRVYWFSPVPWTQQEYNKTGASK